MSENKKKSSWQTLEEYKDQKLRDMAGAAVTESEVKRFRDSMAKDPYTSRNEFKKGFYDQADKPPITYDTMYGTDRNIIQGEMNKVDQLGNVISANPAYAMGGLTEQPHLGYIPRTKGGSILAKGNKLAKHKPTKLY
jgi:hypothetical protein